MPGGAKRGRVEEAEVALIRGRLLEQLAFHLERDAESLNELCVIPACGTAPTLLELGLKSAACSALKGWVVRDLEAELTTFELFKTPFDELIELIVLARSRSIGLPELQLPNPSAPNS